MSLSLVCLLTVCMAVHPSIGGSATMLESRAPPVLLSLSLCLYGHPSLTLCVFSDFFLSDYFNFSLFCLFLFCSTLPISLSLSLSLSLSCDLSLSLSLSVSPVLSLLCSLSLVLLRKSLRLLDNRKSYNHIRNM